MTSLTYRLNATVLAIVVVVTSIMVLASSYYLYNRTILDLKADTDQTTSLAELSLIDRLWDFDGEGVADIAKAMLVNEKFAVISVRDKSGHIQVKLFGKGYENLDLENFPADQFFTVHRTIRKDQVEIGQLSLLVSTSAARKKITNNTLTILFGSMFLSLLLIGSVAGAANRLIKQPILKLRRETSDIISGNLLSPVDASRDDEIGELARDFAHMRDSIREKIEIIEQHNLKLEEKVLERTKQLEQKNNELLAVFSSLQEGILTFTNTNSFEPEFSPYVFSIFGITSIKGLGLRDLLYSKSAKQSDSSEQCLSALDAILGSPEINYDLNKFLLPRDHSIQVGDQTKILDLSWSPVLSNEGIIDKMVLSVRDMTEILAVRALALSNQETVRILHELMNSEASAYNRFFDALQPRIQSIRQLFQVNTPESIRDGNRSLHTIKGNARSFGFAALSDKTHEIEGEIKDALQESPIFHDNIAIIKQLSKLSDICNQYLSVKRKIVKIYQAEIKIIFGDIVTALLNDLQGRDSPLLREFSVRLNDMFIRQDLHSSLESLALSALPSIARDCLKPLPELTIQGGMFFIEGEQLAMLSDIFIHLFRNSIDHGIEKPSDRQLLRKSANGKIEISIQNLGADIEIVYQDDGGGLDIGRLREVMVQMNILKPNELPSVEQVQEAIFMDGFSTASKITSVSGRGVGMSAVRSLITEHEGTIECEILNAISLDSKQVKIRWIIRLPRLEHSKSILVAS